MSVAPIVPVPVVPVPEEHLRIAFIRQDMEHILIPTPVVPEPVNPVPVVRVPRSE